jgi:transcriptional regulator with PAS, ATPase and Fis domain
MEKILISWLAHVHDFTREPNKGTQINTEGSPNYQFHKHFYKHDKHVILHTEQDEVPAALLRTELGKKFPEHKVELIQVNIPDPIDLADIKPKVEAQLMKLKGNEIDIFFSPGTSIMQVTWFICHTSLGLKTRLIQTRAAKFTKTGKPEMTVIETEMSTVPISAVIRETSESKAQGDTIEELHLTASLKKVYDRAFKIAQTDHVTCLIIGESGTGKENLARYIHNNSPRKDEAYLALNCSALSDQLLESRLFGYKKGAFTGAEKDTPGIFENVNKGTLFMDEIGDISPYMQQSLLRVLQEGTFIPVGEHKEKKTDVRIIAATNKNLKQLCKDGKFRWDLYYRLSVVDIEVPSLAGCRPDEVDELFEYFLDVKKKKLEKAIRLKPSKEVLQVIKNYSFPGNIRELENLTEKLYVFCDKSIELNDLPSYILNPEESTSLKIDDVEKALIEKVLKLKQYNQRQTQLTIGYKSINTLRSKIEKYGIKMG